MHDHKPYQTISERYSRDEMLRCALIHHTYDFGYCPIVFINPYGLRKQTAVTASGKYTVYNYDLRAYYLLQIWKQAKSNTDNRLFRWDSVEWYYNPDAYFQKMVFIANEKRRTDAKHFFWNELKSIADSGSVIVEEKITVSPEEKYFLLNSIGSKNEHSSAIDLAESITLDIPKRRTWKWSDIKDFFIELTESEIEILHGKNLNQCTTRDLALFEACKIGDFSGIKEAIKNGAQVNAIDKDGYSTLSYLLSDDAFERHFSDTSDDESYPRERLTTYYKKIQSIIDYLLENGLNINLYGFDSGQDAIALAHWLGSLELLQYVINKGANVNQNCYLTDLNFESWAFTNSSSIYDLVETDIGLAKHDDYYDMERLLKEEKILENAGVKYWADGWNNEKTDAFFAKLHNKNVYE